MGLFFSNLQIKKNSLTSIEEIKKYIISDMSSKGCTLLDSSENADVTAVIYAPDNSSWTTVSSDFYNFNDNNDTSAAANPVSDRLKTDVIASACIDSDFAFMHLVNTSENVDGWINSGTPYTKPPRKTKISPWKSVVSDFEKFKEAVNEKSAFAENVFYGTAEYLGMDESQSVLAPDETERLNHNALTVLYFFFPQSKEKVLPLLDVKRYDLCPCRADFNSVVFANNHGGRSKGVAVMFAGDYIENDEIVIYDATFESEFGSENRKEVPITLEKRKAADGKYILWWEDTNFQIPPAVNPAIPTMKRMNIEFKKEFGIRFFVKGNEEKFRDIEVYIIPLENIQGYARWNVQKMPGRDTQIVI